MAAAIIKAPGGTPYHDHHPWYFFTTGNDLMFALRTTLAGLASLFAAMWLQLDVPRWAVATVFIVSPPVRGNALRKTASRAIGTIVGCVVGVAAVALFAQGRIVYNLAFAAWLGACAYWGTLKRGFVSYGATLAAFTSAIVAADVASTPQNVFDAAVNRGSATLLGVLFALFASEIASRSDDVPGDLVDRVSALAAQVLQWSAQHLERPIDSNPPPELEVAPFSGEILAVDELTINAMAERSALRWVRHWIVGLPAALLSLQSAVLDIGRAVRSGHVDSRKVEPVRRALLGVCDVLEAGARTPVSALREQAASLALLGGQMDATQTDYACDSGTAREGTISTSVPPALMEVVSALRYLLASIETILVLKEPNQTAIKDYSAPKFIIHRERARINLLRTVVGMLLSFAIWDITAWTEGALFMVGVAIALVIFVMLDNPVAGNRNIILGTVVGGVAGLAFKYLLLVWSNEFFWLAIVLFPLLFVAVWAQTKPQFAALGIFYVNGLLISIEPTNPQQYDFAQGLNTLIALAAGYAFVPLVFMAIGTPKTGARIVGNPEVIPRRSMFLPMREIDIFGIFVAPAAVMLGLCAGVFLVARWALNQVLDLDRCVWRRPLMDIACFVVFYCLAILTMCRG